MPELFSYSNSSVLGGAICWASANSFGGASSNISTDGHTYTSHDEAGALTFQLTTLVAGNSKFILLHGSLGDNSYFTSSDAITWASYTFPEALTLASVAVHGGGKTVIVDSGAGYCFTTIDDGTTWNQSSFPMDKGSSVSLTYSPTSGLYLWAGDSTYYMTSTTGLSWTLHSYPSNVGSGQVIGK